MTIFSADEPKIDPVKLATAVELHSAIWQNINREDTLSNYRVVWAITATNGLLLAVTVLLSTSAYFGKQSIFSEKWIFLITALMASGGFLFCFVSWLAIRASYRQISYLKKLYNEKIDIFAQSGLPTPWGERGGAIQRFSAAEMFPFFLGSMWLCVVFLASALFLRSIFPTPYAAVLEGVRCAISSCPGTEDSTLRLPTPKPLQPSDHPAPKQKRCRAAA